MEIYRSIKIDYSTRKKRYTFYNVKPNEIIKGMKKFIGSGAHYILEKKGKNAISIYEFFLLEFMEGLEYIKEYEINIALKIGGEIISDLISYIKTNTWVSDRFSEINMKLDLNKIKRTMKFEPLPHQLKAYKTYERVKEYGDLRGFLLDAQVGAGKTYVSLSLAEVLDYRYIIILAPKPTIEEVWIKSITESLYKSPQPYQRLEGKITNLNTKARFFIMHYEYLEKVVNNKYLMSVFKRRKPMLIVDEFHNFNEIKSKRTQNLLKFVEHVDFQDIALLTGTPIKMNVTELKPMLYILDKKFPPIVDMFDKVYTAIYTSNLDLLRKRFGLYRERIDIGTNDLPKLTIEEYKISIPNGERFTVDSINEQIKKYKEKRLKEIYGQLDVYIQEFESLIGKVRVRLSAILGKTEANKIINKYLTLVKQIRNASRRKQLMFVMDKIRQVNEIENDYIVKYLEPDELKRFKEIRAIVKYPELKVLGEALGRILLRNRIECYKELAKHLNYRNLIELSPKKSLIFSNYISVCEIAMEKTRKHGYNPLPVYGKYTEYLDKNVKLFNDLSNNYNPLVATYKSLSTGVPLTAANIVICLDLPFRNYIFQQAIARAWRIGNDQPVTVFIIKLDTGNKFNITERDLFIINLSQERVETITGNKDPYELPKQDLTIEEPEESELPTDVEEELEEDIETEVEKIFNNEMVTKFIEKDSILNDIYSFMKKIKMKLG